MFILKDDFFDFDLYQIAEPALPNLEGRNNDSAMIFVYEQDYQVHKVLLSKIISAIGFDGETFKNIVRLTKGEELNASAISDEFTSYLISFGIAPSKLGFNATFKGYKTYQTETFRVLLSHSLQKLNDSKEHKKALWSELQKEFSKA